MSHILQGGRQGFLVGRQRVLYLHLFSSKKNFEFHEPLLYIGFNCLKLQSHYKEIQYLTTKSLGDPGTHLIVLRRMKDWMDLGAAKWFCTQDPQNGNPAPQPLCQKAFQRYLKMAFIYSFSSLTFKVSC